MPRAFYTVMWETGLRTGTIARLSVPEHYEPGRSALSVTDAIDKVRFGRELPLTSRARDVLDAVSPRRGLVFGDRNLVGQLRRAARAAGLSDERARRVSNHHLRHARATHLASRSDNLVGVAFLLGHKHLTTTAIYARPRERAAREVIAAIDGSGEVMRGAFPGAPVVSSGSDILESVPVLE
jgi:site-specific recombinase XerC